MKKIEIKTAEEALKAIFLNEWDDVDPAYKKLYIEILELFAKEVAEEQREACRKNYKKAQAENIYEKIKEANSSDYVGNYNDLRKAISATPLVTNKLK